MNYRVEFQILLTFLCKVNGNSKFLCSDTKAHVHRKSSNAICEMVIQLADHPEISDCGVTKGTGQYPAVNGTDDVDLIS